MWYEILDIVNDGGDTYIDVVQGIKVHQIMQPLECLIWILKVEGWKWWFGVIKNIKISYFFLFLSFS